MPIDPRRTRWFPWTPALRRTGPWADFEHEGVKKLKSDSAHEVYTITDAQVAEWRKAAEPLQQSWAGNVKKAGGDPDAIMKELKDSLAKYSAAF